MLWAQVEGREKLSATGEKMKAQEGDIISGPLGFSPAGEGSQAGPPHAPLSRPSSLASTLRLCLSQEDSVEVSGMVTWTIPC